MSIFKRRELLASVLGIAACVGTAYADTWPSKPVRIIVPYAPGGTVDIFARLVADKLGTEFGQTFFIDNRPGAGGNIGTGATVRAVPDGYTLSIAGNPTHVLNPHLYKDIGFDPIKDMTSIALIGTAPNLLVINPKLPVKTVTDLMELARKQPGSITFASSGIGLTGHLAGELLARQAKAELRHIPYAGQADAVSAVIRGDVSMAFVTVPGTLAQVEAGRLKALAITSLARSSLVPEVPTVSESGFPNFEVLAWYNMSGPAKMPADITSRLTAALYKVMADGAVKTRLGTLGLEPRVLVGAEYVSFMNQESSKWGKIIRDAGITAK